MVDPVATRRREREQLLATARSYADRLAELLPVQAVAVFGSVARGDFNVWSDIDVLVIAEELPERAVERTGLLLRVAPVGVQPVGFSRDEFSAALAARNPLALEAVEHGVALLGHDVLEALAGA